MIAMLDAFRRSHPDIDVKDSTLQWGNPFYTKLAMAAAGNRAPDLGVMHMGRVTGFSPGRLLDPWDVDLLAKYGVREQDYNPALWKRGVIDGKLYALPLDIHVQLCFYRKDVLGKAGLLGDDGRMIPVTSTDEWFDVLKKAKSAQKKGLQTIGLWTNDQNFQWWFFVAFYTQLGGKWFDDANTVVLTVSALAGYGFARTEFRGKGVLMGLVMSGLMVSPAVLGVPLFTTVQQMGMVDTYWGMSLPQCAPAAMVYILYKFFQGIPRELEEAAFIDGAGRWRVFFTIVVPLARPSLAAVGIFTFIASWNNFLWPYMVTNNPDLMTMPNGIATVMNSYGIQWAQLMAGGLMAGLPLIIVFVFFQRQIVTGVAHTGLAGQ
ncbi:extracellular solute-binding protein [Streptomyces shaanxiensis]